MMAWCTNSLTPLMGGVDCTFTFRDDSMRTKDWAALCHDLPLHRLGGRS